LRLCCAVDFYSLLITKDVYYECYCESWVVIFSSFPCETTLGLLSSFNLLTSNLGDIYYSNVFYSNWFYKTASGLLSYLAIFKLSRAILPLPAFVLLVCSSLSGDRFYFKWPPEGLGLLTFYERLFDVVVGLPLLTLLVIFKWSLLPPPGAPKNPYPVPPKLSGNFDGLLLVNFSVYLALFGTKF